MRETQGSVPGTRERRGRKVRYLGMGGKPVIPALGKPQQKNQESKASTTEWVQSQPWLYSNLEASLG